MTGVVSCALCQRDYSSAVTDELTNQPPVARDIQKFEDHPFAAFNAKNFASTVSPWVVTLDALQPFKVEPKPQDPLEVPPYLADPEEKGTYDISINMAWSLGKEGETFSATTSNLQNAYWSFKQMLTHHAFGGCQMRTGDLVGTGTITGEDEGSICSLVERTKDGKIPVKTPKGNTRMYVDDGDEVVFTAWAGSNGPEMDGKRVGFGTCGALILPAVPL
jgi:fumarylacetoacetase